MLYGSACNLLMGRAAFRINYRQFIKSERKFNYFACRRRPLIYVCVKNDKGQKATALKLLVAGDHVFC
jgi:hypothetical protein